jgi:hypothetical protein
VSRRREIGEGQRRGALARLEAGGKRHKNVGVLSDMEEPGRE